MANEGEKVLQQALVWMQRQQEKFGDNGILVTYNDEDYVFLPTYIDRLVN